MVYGRDDHLELLLRILMLLDVELHSGWRREMGGISTTHPPGQVERQGNIQSGSRKWVGSVQHIHLGKSRGRTTYTLEAGNGWDQCNTSTWAGREAGQHTCLLTNSFL
ncbi:hypothetical protein FA13DRAFT_1732278, partial [Coprinellus micaceus]